MISSIRALTALLTATAMLAACGGGSGGPDSASPAGAPLTLTASNAASVAQLAPAAGESVLSVAQFAVDSVQRFSLPGTSSPSVATCPNGGRLMVALVDRDRNGIASVGDLVSIEAQDCAVPVLTDVVTGTLQIELSASPSLLPAAVSPAGLRASINFGSGLRIGATGADTATVLGSMLVDWVIGDVQSILRVTASAADDLRVVHPGAGGAAQTESILQPNLLKNLNYDEARSIVSLFFQYQSSLLNGRITVVTPVSLGAYLNTFPDSGRLEISGASGGKIVLTPQPTGDGRQFRYAFDANGDGTPESTGNSAWSDSTEGYLWWDGVTALNGWTEGAFRTRALATGDLRVDAAFTWINSTSSSIRLQFSRPLASSTPIVLYRFVDQGSLDSDGSPKANINGNAEIRGALVIVRPATGLRHNHRYTLQASPNGLNWSGGATFVDVAGNVMSSSLWNISATTPDGLRAMAYAQSATLIDAASRVVLSGQTSIGTPRPIVSYQWTQVSGTALNFSSTTAAQITVSWGATPPSSAETAVIRLTVADAFGDSDSMDVSIGFMNVSVLYFRSAPGDYIGQGMTSQYDSSAATFIENHSATYFNASIWPGISGVWWFLDLATGDGSPLHTGAYENAVRAPFRGNQNGIDFTGSGRGCNQMAGRFDVLEIQTDSNGAVIRLAVDFEQHCESASAPPLFGSYRMNSSLPIRP